MFEQLNFEAEPFKFKVEPESELMSRRYMRRYARRGSPVEQEFEATKTAAGVPQCVTAQLKTPPPKGLVLLPHLHIPKTPQGNASGVACMDVAGMNPGFIVNDKLVFNSTPTGLHTRLNALIQSTYKKYAWQMSVALVDLTGARLFAPDFAGYHSTAAMYGASLPKISALYAVHQLFFELQIFANRLKLTTKAALVAHVRGLWDKAGLPRNQQPNLDFMFVFTEVAPQPVVVEMSSNLEELLSCTYAGSCNRTASLLIDRVGLAYIGSVLWQSGLFHHTQGGLWLTALYGRLCDSSCTPGCCFPQFKFETTLKPVYVRPSTPVGGHNATALSAVTFFTLMAQGRLADDNTSNRIKNDLKDACTLFRREALTCVDVMPTKCGYITSGYFNDVALVERKVAPGCTGKTIRYALALMTKGIVFSKNDGRAFFKEFLIKADALIQQNNP